MLESLTRKRHLFRMQTIYRAVILSFLLVFFTPLAKAAEPSIEIIEFDSKVLANNPLHDPTLRKVAVFSPKQATKSAQLPVVYYLPGFGGSAEGFIKDQAKWLKVVQKISDEVTPVRLAVVDGRTRWSCSQYVNSSAQGFYGNYIADEIVAHVEAKFPAPWKGVRRVIAGHSSGGFGALRMGMLRPKFFDGVIALSPDSDFDTTHIYLSTDPSVTNASPSQITAIMSRSVPAPKGELLYAVALSAAYAPIDWKHPGQFEWLFDVNGRFRTEIWHEWLNNDPLVIVRRDRKAFRATQAIYLEGAQLDEYKANIGARKIYEALHNRQSRCTFYEPPGKHGEHVPERLQRGIAWIFNKPVKDL